MCRIRFGIRPETVARLRFLLLVMLGALGYLVADDGNLQARVAGSHRMAEEVVDEIGRQGGQPQQDQDRSGSRDSSFECLDQILELIPEPVAQEEKEAD